MLCGDGNIKTQLMDLTPLHVRIDNVAKPFLSENGTHSDHLLNFNTFGPIWILRPQTTTAEDVLVVHLPTEHFTPPQHRSFYTSPCGLSAGNYLSGRWRYGRRPQS